MPVKSLENTFSSSKIYSYILLNGDAQVWDFDETGYNGWEVWTSSPIIITFECWRSQKQEDSYFTFPVVRSIRHNFDHQQHTVRKCTVMRHRMHNHNQNPNCLPREFLPVIKIEKKNPPIFKWLVNDFSSVFYFPANYPL